MLKINTGRAFKTSTVLWCFSVGLGAIFLSGCMSLRGNAIETKEISKDEFISEVKQYENTLHDFIYDRKSATSFAQPENIKQKCLIPSLFKAEGEKIYWDGKCENGYAKGIGRAIALTDSSQEDAILDVGNFVKDKRVVAVLVKTSLQDLDMINYTTSFNDEYLVKYIQSLRAVENISTGEISKNALYFDYDNQDSFSLSDYPQQGINAFYEINGKNYAGNLDNLLINVKDNQAWSININTPSNIKVLLKGGFVKGYINVVEDGKKVDLQPLFKEHFNTMHASKVVYQKMLEESSKISDDLLNKYQYYKDNYAKRPQGVSKKQYEALFAKLEDVAKLRAQRIQQQQEYQRQEQIKQAQIDAYRAKQQVYESQSRAAQAQERAANSIYYQNTFPRPVNTNCYTVGGYINCTSF